MKYHGVAVAAAEVVAYTMVDQLVEAAYCTLHTVLTDHLRLREKRCLQHPPVSYKYMIYL